MECLPMVQKTRVKSQVKSYKRLKKWYLMPPCLTLSIIRYGSRVKWSNPGKGVAPSSAHWCCSYWKGCLQVTLDKGCQLWFNLYIYNQSWRAVWLNLGRLTLGHVGIIFIILRALSHVLSSLLCFNLGNFFSFFPFE